MTVPSPLFTDLRIVPLVASLLFLLTGCSQSDWEEPYREYLSRLSRTLEQPHTKPQPRPRARMPRPSEIQLEFESGNLDGIDFLSLRGCELQLTIGKRNSSLGRMARDSQRLLLELEFLQLAPDCIARLEAEGKTDLAATLQEAWHAKRRQLPGRIFNATLGASEYRELWQPSSPGENYPDNTSAEPLEALGQINTAVERWLGGDYRFDNQAFEILLSEVAMGDAGELWFALAVQDAWLASADAAIKTSIQTGPLCADNFRADAADIMPNVISRFFVDGTQPRAAALGRRYHQLLPLLQQLESHLAPALPKAYSDWASGRDRQLDQLAAAPRAHVKQLQALLAPCGERKL